MDNISVIKKANRIVVRRKLKKNENVNEVEWNIINRGEIRELFPVQFSKRLFEREIRVSVQAIADLGAYLKSGLRFDQFASVVVQMVEIIQRCESYGISGRNLLLDSSLVFYDHSLQRVRMICWPVISLQSESTLLQFFEEIGTAYICRGRDESYRQQYLQCFQSRSQYGLDRLQMVVEGLLKAWKQERFGVRPAVIPVVQTQSAAPLTVHPGGSTAVTLVNRTDRSVIQISRYPFCVGRVSKFCDFAIDNDTFISKRHFIITLNNNQLFIRDTGSANGTLLNGRRLSVNTEVPLSAGDCIKAGQQELILTVSPK